MNDKYDLTILKKSAEIRHYLEYQCETWRDSKTLNTLDEYFEIINELLAPIIENAKYDGIAYSAYELKEKCFEFLKYIVENIWDINQ